jgi:two-component system, LytTR family, sensor kinase
MSDSAAADDRHAAIRVHRDVQLPNPRIVPGTSPWQALWPAHSLRQRHAFQHRASSGSSRSSRSSRSNLPEYNFLVPAPLTTAALVNLVGFFLGASLYGLLLAMALGSRVPSSGAGRRQSSASTLLLFTGLLGLTWNIGEMLTYGMPPPALGGLLAWRLVVSFAALGFLPAVVVHSVVAAGAAIEGGRARTMVTAAYGVSTSAAGLHALAAARAESVPSLTGLTILTVGFSILMVTLLVSTRRRPSEGRHTEGRTTWVVALSVFAVTALHLAQHTGGESWWTEMIGHHASLPLAFAILHRDYRFALADIFLERAITLTLLVAVALGVHLTIGLSSFASPGAAGAATAPTTLYLLGLVLVTAVLHDSVRRAAKWVVDTVVLRRADYAEVSASIARELAAAGDDETALGSAGSRLVEALDASWLATRQLRGPLPAGLGTSIAIGSAADGLLRELALAPVGWESDATAPRGRPAHVVSVVPTVDPPRYVWLFGEPMGGRRLLSDDLSLVDSVAASVGRRLDALRVAHERFEVTLREQQMSQLATEAELRALRAQLNPHFLFNALTTIGYLIQEAPERAQATLLRLTSLLRGVLRRTTSEFVSLGEEIELVQAYLEIEEARFEERLRVAIDVPAALRMTRVPSLVLQPLVENAIKHGIAPSAEGGEVHVVARSESLQGRMLLHITVRDTGVGTTARLLDRGRTRGLGIASVERRLRGHYGARASLTVTSAPDEGTRVDLVLPGEAPSRAADAPSITVH